MSLAILDGLLSVSSLSSQRKVWSCFFADPTCKVIIVQAAALDANAVDLALVFQNLDIIDAYELGQATIGRIELASMFNSDEMEENVSFFVAALLENQKWGPFFIV